MIDKYNFIQYAMKHYDNPQCLSIEEFNNDLKRFCYLQKLLIRYSSKGDLQHKLILNHIIILFNLFDSALIEMLKFKISKEYWATLWTFILYLKRLPEEIIGTFLPDQNVIDVLRRV